MSDQSFGRNEKLKSSKMIQKLFAEGKANFVHPIKWVYLPVEFEANRPPVQFTVSVSKKTFKRAVDRNLIKRRIREAYRLQKSTFLSLLKENQKSFAVMAIYVGKSTEDFKVIHNAILRHLKKMKKMLEN